MQTLNDVIRDVDYAERGPAMQRFWEHMEATAGCDFCGSENARGLLWIPDPIVCFFDLERLCVYCRESINATSREYEWPICWGSTSDEEIKWFLVAHVLREFKKHFQGQRGEFVMWFQCCVEGAHARRASVKPEPFKWPEPEWVSQPYEVPDLQIELKPEFRKPRVRARVIEATET